MHLNDQEQSMLDGSQGPLIAEAMDYLVQFGEAFGAERLIDVGYCHYPTEMSIYEGNVEDLLQYSARGACVKIPTTTSTLACDLEKPAITGAPEAVCSLQAKAESAHRSMGILETYTCTPQFLGFLPPFGSYAALVESSAIIYYNSVLGVRSNRGGLFTRFSAVTGKYPLMGFLLDENRKGTHWFDVQIDQSIFRSTDAYSALGMYIGSIVGSEVPVITGIAPRRQEELLALGATLATSGSVTLFHIPGITPEAPTIEAAFHGKVPSDRIIVGEAELNSVYSKYTNIAPGDPVDFVTIGCPHYNLEQLRYIAERLRGRRVADGLRFWICTNRMTRKQAEYSGYVQTIEMSGALVVADTCPVESHMRLSTCREFGLKTPNVEAMICDSGKMLRYVGDLIGCKTALSNLDNCIKSALEGRFINE